MFHLDQRSEGSVLFLLLKGYDRRFDQRVAVHRMLGLGCGLCRSRLNNRILNSGCFRY